MNIGLSSYFISNRNYAHLEAEFYKTRSRYLFLLKEIQMPVRGECCIFQVLAVYNKFLHKANLWFSIAHQD